MSVTYGRDFLQADNKTLFAQSFMQIWALSLVLGRTGGGLEHTMMYLTQGGPVYRTEKLYIEEEPALLIDLFLFVWLRVMLSLKGKVSGEGVRLVWSHSTTRAVLEIY